MVDSVYASTEPAAKPDKSASPPYQRLRDWFLRRAWYVHPGAHLRLTTTPSETYKVLEIAAKPSVKRLHLRNVFTQGRRYFIMPRDGGGFRMMTTNKIPWYPSRTSASAVLTGDFEKIDDTTSRLTMKSRIRTFYMLQSLFMPSFMASMLIFMRWHLVLIAASIVTLYSLSWMAHRYNAALEAYEMIFFIEKALEDHIPEPPPVLNAPAMSGAVIIENGFAAERDKFVDEMQDD